MVKVFISAIPMQAAAVAVVKASQYKIYSSKNSKALRSPEGFVFYCSSFFTGTGGGGGGGGGIFAFGGLGGLISLGGVIFSGSEGSTGFTSGTTFGGGGGGGSFCFSWAKTAVENNSITPARQIFNRFIIKIFDVMRQAKESINFFTRILSN